MTWNKRARTVRKSHCTHRVLNSKDGCYRVVESKIHLGDGAYPARVFAIRVCGNVERLISRHRKINAAKRACEADARKGGAA